MEFLLLLLLVLVSVQRSECVRCFSYFDRNSGQCDNELGEVDEDNCCQNPLYGYLGDDGKCHSCSPPTWSRWSQWSPCNVLGGEGVRQRRRTCYGIGNAECENNEDKLQTIPCTGNCLDAVGWGPWQGWSSCSVTCGEGGVRTRKRLCASSAGCRATCTGASEEKEDCPVLKCPVRGEWSDWSAWSQCSEPCIDDGELVIIMPTRTRYRSCSNPPPSNDTVPHGDACPGDALHVQDCSELPNCAVHGNWGSWSALQPCTVTCGEGLQLSSRQCDQPAPKYGGRFCDGPSTRTSICQSACPVDGFWSGWSSWSDCSASCIPQGQLPVRSRQRSCSNPAPSDNPRGKSCSGHSKHTEDCNNLPRCPVDGAWGSWSPYVPCSVTCGVGLQESVRKCDSPAPAHGGQPCPGEDKRTTVRMTNVHCPVDGVWAEWSPWQPCTYAFDRTKPIRCQDIGGRQKRRRRCLHRAHNGSICIGPQYDSRSCYDITDCRMKGTWDGWENWSLCEPACGENSRRLRKRKCAVDFSRYEESVGRQTLAVFFGIPKANCGPAPDGVTFEAEPCVNVPACSDIPF